MNIEWEKLGFEFRPTKSNIRYVYDDGKWDDGKLYTTYDITLSVASNCLHYGQAAFEGLKAFRCKDGKVRVFRPEENAKRLNSTCRHILMPEVPEALFLDAVKRVVRDNIDYVPPYGTGGSLYIRPVMIGTTPQIGISSSRRYELILLVVPVGPYYKGGIKPVNAMISDDMDRAAPHGTGHIKIAGNYAASLYPSKVAKEHGCQVALFLDPKTHEFIDEFGTSNFLAITKDGKYVTPKSASVLPSVTNKSLMQLAADLGMPVEQRRINKAELADFTEVGACGTAVVITPIGKIFYRDQVFDYGDTIGPVLKKLYEVMTGTQYGELPDRYGWLMEL
ncbi:branched-chain amino acid aminotransferase [Victivallis sp. Marseille-Q1083]|uniref:branched-chain amino acid aminotransferase n=1 Tax=Victivallis sp. Marseille-Q1083 TaxID=2717288 RepID=UPI001588DDA9|nr:branched-chain amino acid aminotransferase [Victivallis sp. Marseille-Q1083]